VEIAAFILPFLPGGNCRLYFAFFYLVEIAAFILPFFLPGRNCRVNFAFFYLVEIAAPTNS
jgi:hypothetical protein